MKRYLITTSTFSAFDESEHTRLADSKSSALDMLSLITNDGDQQLVSVIEVDIYNANSVKLEPYLNNNMKLDLREKQ